MTRHLAMLSLVAGFAPSLTTGAADVREKSLSEILSESRAVVHGRVVDQFSQWEAIDGNSIIFTYSTIQVQNGQFRDLESASQVVVRTVGGTVDGYTQLLIDEASFVPGEEVVTFLTLEEGWGHLSVTNLRQGKYTVVRGDGGNLLGLRQDPGQQVHRDLHAEQPLIAPARFAAEYRQAALQAASGDDPKITPLTRIR